MGLTSFIGDRIAKSPLLRTRDPHAGHPMKVYGIVNCNTVKAARAWLQAHKLAYEFVDFKKIPPTKELLAKWCAAFGWERVLNRRGTTWRLLPPAVQTSVTD